VLTLPACVQRLDSTQRRVLVLRAGVGARAPRSRRRVASRLHVTVRRVARVERAGMRRLRTLQRTNSCAAAPAGTAGVVARGGLAPVSGSGTGPGTPAAPTHAPSGGGSSSEGNSSDGGPGGGSRQGIGGQFATSPPGPLGSDDGGPSPVIPIVLAALAAASAAYLAVGGVRTLRARRH
jgi:hypothetical protein